MGEVWQDGQRMRATVGKETDRELSPPVCAIADEIERRGWSVQETAERAGVSFKSIYTLLDGSRNGNITTIVALARALGLDSLPTKRRNGRPPKARRR